MPSREGKPKDKGYFNKNRKKILKNLTFVRENI